MQVQGQYPQQWAPFQVTGLLHAWQISHQISRYLYHEGRQLRASTLCNPSLSAASKSSWASHAPLPTICMSKAVLTALLEHSMCPYQRSLLSFRMRSRSSVPSCASSSVDLMLAVPCGLTLQIWLIIQTDLFKQPDLNLSCSAQQESKRI